MSPLGTHPRSANDANQSVTSWNDGTQALNRCLCLSVVETDDSPMQEMIIQDPAVTHLTLKGLDRHSHYRFYLRGRTSAGQGEPMVKEGATTLDGGGIGHMQDQIAPEDQTFDLSVDVFSAPPTNISVSRGERFVNVSWVAKKRHRNVNFQIHCLKKNGTISTNTR